MEEIGLKARDPIAQGEVGPADEALGSKRAKKGEGPTGRNRDARSGPLGLYATCNMLFAQVTQGCAAAPLCPGLPSLGPSARPGAMNVT